MTGIFSLLLWFGGFLCFFGFAIQEDKEEDQSNLYLGIVLCLVVFVTGCFSFAQASSAESLMDDFKGFIPKMADVVRDGKKIKPLPLRASPSVTSSTSRLVTTSPPMSSLSKLLK